MKKLLFIAACFSSLAAFSMKSTFLPKKSTGKLLLNFEKLETQKGILRLALYDSKANFMVEEKAMLHNFKVTATQNQTFEITGLPFGEYAFAIFQDENENQKLDKNLFGVPVEPYGFSENPKAKWRLPTFEESSFRVNQSSQTLQVRLERWRL